MQYRAVTQPAGSVAPEEGGQRGGGQQGDGEAELNLHCLGSIGLTTLLGSSYPELTIRQRLPSGRGRTYLHIQRGAGEHCLLAASSAHCRFRSQVKVGKDNVASPSTKRPPLAST